jgi:hypothetical protein
MNLVPRIIRLPLREHKARATIGRMAKRKNPAAVALGRRGGLAAAGAGGRAIAASRTPEERSEAARRAVLARWRSEKSRKKK